MPHPLLLPGTILTLQDDVTSRGGVVVEKVSSWGEITWQDTCAGATNRGYARFTIPADARARTSALIGNVARIDQLQPSGAAVPRKTWEYRITKLDDAVVTPDNPWITVECSPIINDFGRVQLRTVNGGVPTKRVVFTGTPLAFLTALLLPALAAQGITGVVAGTVVAGPALTFSSKNASVLAVLSWLEEQHTVDAWLDRVDDTTFALNLTQRGAGVAAPIAWVGKNVEVLDRTQLIDDDRFANVIEPEGLTANGEQDPTHIGQADWSATARSGGGGRVITLADPLGADGPVASDDALNGLQAVYPLDPLHLAQAPTILASSTIGAQTQPGAPYALAFDSTRRILWGYTQDDTDTIWWRSVVDDASAGTVSLGTAGQWVNGLAYDAVHDRIVAILGDVAKAVLVNAGTKAVAATVTTAAIPWGVSVAPGLGRAFVGYDPAGGVPIDVIDTSSGTIAGTLAGTATFDGRFITAVYHAGTGRVFLFDGDYAWFNASTLAAIGTGSGAQGQPCQDPAASEILLLYANGTDTIKRSIDPSTGALTNTDLDDFPATPAQPGANCALVAACGRHYFVTARYIVGFDAAANAWVLPVGDVGRGDQPFKFRIGIAVELGPSASENTVFYTADIGGIRRHVCTAAADPVSPFESWPVQDSDAAAQTITAPASGSGGPVTVPVEADGAGQGARVQLRADAALTYRTQLRDPTSIAAYGEVDASPSYGVLAKTNYWRGSTFDAGTWRADRTNRWITQIVDDVAHFGASENRWSQADQSGFAFRPITLTAAYTGTGTYPDLTLAVSGLNNGTVLSPGDVITNHPMFGGAGGIFPRFWYVRQRTVADGSGNATIPVTASPDLDDGIAYGIGATLYLTSPSLLIANNRADCLVLYPTRHITSGVHLTWPIWSAIVPVPRLLGDSRAWVVCHVKLANYRFKPSDLKMTVGSPFNHTELAAAAATISPLDTVELTTGELRNYWLSQPIELANHPTHGFVRVELTCGPTSTMITGLHGVLYIQSLQVVLAATTTEPLDVYGGEGPRVLAQLGQARLAAGNTPTQNYALTVVDGDGAWDVGVEADLRDPTRGIAARGSSTRIITNTQFGVPPNTPLRLPAIEIGHAPLANFATSIADTATAAKTTDDSVAIRPGTPLPAGAPAGGGAGTPPVVGNRVAMPLVWAASLGLGETDCYTRWYTNSTIANASGGGRDGKDAIAETDADHYNEWKLAGSGDSAERCFQFGFDLNGVAVATEVPVCTLYPTTVSVTVTPSRRIRLYLDPGTGFQNGTQVWESAGAVPSSGPVMGLLRVKYGASGTGYVQLRINGEVVILASTTVWNAGNAQQFLSLDTGTGSANWGFFSPPGYGGGLAGVRWFDIAVFDPTGSAQDDYPGDVHFDVLDPNAAGTYNDSGGPYTNVTDDNGDTSYNELVTAGQKDTYNMSSLSGSVVTVLAVIPAWWFRHATAIGSSDIRLLLQSGATLATAPAATNAFTLGTFYKCVYNASAGWGQRWIHNTNPDTSAAWTIAEVNAIEVGPKANVLNSGVTVRFSKIAAEVAYWDS